MDLIKIIFTSKLGFNGHSLTTFESFSGNSIVTVL